MDPQYQPTPGLTPPPPPPNPYEFIVNPQKPPRKPFLSGGLPGIKDPFIAKMVMLVGGIVAAIIIFGIIFSTVFGDKTDYTGMIGLAQAQTELVRVATEATSQTTVPPTQNLAINVELSIQTQQQQFTDYLAKQGHKLGSKTLNAKRDANTDNQLASATQSSTFDSVFAQIMQNDLQNYVSELQQVEANPPGPTGKQLVTQALNGAQTLLAQVPTSSTLQSQIVNPNQN